MAIDDDITFLERVPTLSLLGRQALRILAIGSENRYIHEGISLFGEVFINNRGIIVPAPVVGEGAGVVFATLAVGVLAAIVLGLWAKRRRVRTGHEFPLVWTVRRLDRERLRGFEVAAVGNSLLWGAALALAIQLLRLRSRPAG